MCFHKGQTSNLNTFVFETAGDVILSPEAWTHILKECDGEVLKGGFVRLGHIFGNISVPLSQRSWCNIEDQLVPKIVNTLKR
jgi:hypothetical protein